MNPVPELSSPERVQKEADYQSLQPVVRPQYWGVDLDPARRPGVPMMRTNPQPWPNTRFPPERQPGEPASPKHGRTNKPMPPVFGTAVPLRGLSGAIRRLAYQSPDHSPRHWLLLMLGDRVEYWGYHLRQYVAFALPLAALVLITRRMRA